MSTTSLGMLLAAAAGTVLLSGCGTAAPAPPAEALRAAFAQSGQSDRLLMTASVGQQLMSPALGIDSSTVVDPANPTVVVEVSPGLEHLRYDVGALNQPLVGTDVGAVLEMWLTDDRIVIDTRSFADALAAADPSVDLGPLDASLSYVDLASVGADAPAVAEALAGSPPPDLTATADRLPGALDQIDQISEHPTRFRGITDYARYVDAVGGDVDATARSATALLALNFGLDPVALANVYVSFFQAATTEVIVELDDLGSVHSVSSRVDLSGLYPFLFAETNAAALGLSPADARAAAQAFEGTIWRIDTITTFEADEQLVVPPPPPTDLDRTAAWRDFMVRSGVAPG